jgi:hypothetical protein
MEKTDDQIIFEHDESERIISEQLSNYYERNKTAKDIIIDEVLKTKVGKIRLCKAMVESLRKNKEQIMEYQDVELVIRVKLPNPINYLGCVNGDDAYKKHREDAIFAVKPPGYEVIWETKENPGL